MIGLKPMVIYKMIVVKMARIVIYRTEETSVREYTGWKYISSSDFS